MLPLQAIEATLQGMRKAQAAADTLQAALTAEVVKISSDSGRTLDYIAEKVKAAREKAVPGIYEQLNLINKEQERLTKTATPYWQDVKFVLSRALLTPASQYDDSQPADPAIEAMSRLAKLTEVNKLDMDSLHLQADSALQQDQHGALYLINLENDSRAGQEKGWSPINLDQVILPERDKALALLKEARAMANTISMQIKVANGRPVSAAERITAARSF